MLPEGQKAQSLIAFRIEVFHGLLLSRSIVLELLGNFLPHFSHVILDKVTQLQYDELLASLGRL